MSQIDPIARPSIDPHSYQPLLVDEDCLSDEEFREALDEALSAPAGGESGGEWRSYVTRQELAELEKELDKLRKDTSPLFITTGELPAVAARKFELARRGIFRGYARRKHNHGARIWCGDGPPPWHRPR